MTETTHPLPTHRAGARWPLAALLALILLAAPWLAAAPTQAAATSMSTPVVAQAIPPSQPPFPADLETATIEDLQALLADPRYSSEQLVRAYVERIHALNTAGPGLNAVRAIAPDALQQARRLDRERRQGQVRGPMHGIPVLLKDNIDVDGMPTTAGALALVDSYPAEDAFLVKRLRAAGAIILGKTNLSEFANFTTSGMPSGYSALGGQVLNPYDASVTPSGSSSGSGVGAVVGMASGAVGTETSGSILSPSVANSVVGVKPTVGLISRTGIVPIAASQDTAGPMTKSVYDAAALLTAMTGIDPEDPATATSAPVDGTDYTAALSVEALQGARIGVASSPGGAQGAAFNAARAVLEAQGATLVPVSITTGGLGPSILTYEFKRDLNAYFDRLPDDAPMKSLDDVVQFNIAHQDVGAIKFGQSILVTSNNIDLDDEAARATYENNRDNGIATARSRIDSALAAADVDAILFSGAGSAGIGARAQYPSVTVPIGYNPGNSRPFGMSFLGTAYSEADLLAFAYAYEQAAGVWLPPRITNPSLFRCTALTEPQPSCAP